MTKPGWFDPKITAGNVITIAVMLVGFFLWGARLEARVDEQSKSLIELKATDVQFATRLEVSRDLAGSRQELILTKLTRLETIIERLERNGSKP